MSISLKSISTRAPKEYDKEQTKSKIPLLISRLSELQAVMFAEKKHSLLIILQGMDASGKDGVVKEVFTGVNPMGCRVQSFKKPTEEELAHDFLWRIHKHTPEKGMIQLFNRSHYEDVLVTRVHHQINDAVAKQRMKAINAFEELLQSHNTHILKFYLHISREEQLKRLNERITNPYKRYKYQSADIEESKHWDRYMEYYEEVFEQCSPKIPWHIVPSDQNWYKEYFIAKTIVDTLEELKMEYPEIQD
ncbi:MAG: polyphosphate kinase [Bacteroidia bacterium]|nr:polyphosphate kinase [Bacteroidia bacterium]